MRMKIDLWYMTVVISFMFRIIQACPGKCDCSRGTEMICRRQIFNEKELRELQIPSSITKVEMVENEIRTISADLLRAFVNLSSLEISNNYLTEILPNTFMYFKNLQKLTLKRNNIQSITQDSFNGLSDLKELSLEYNKIVDLRPGLFNRLRSVQSIRLNNNNIQFIPNRVFHNLRSLKSLYLKQNNISYIGDHAFHNMSMRLIGLSNNKLKRIPVSAFSGVQVSFAIVLFSNQIDCSCRDIMNFATKIKRLEGKIMGNCRTPRGVQGKTIINAYRESKCSLCDLNPCRNGGICTGNKDSFACSCSEKYKGKTCAISICEYKVKYITRTVKVTGKTVLQFQKRDKDNETSHTVTARDTSDTEKKLMILYAMCSLEFIVILCFVALFMWKRYQDWKLLKEYDHQKRTQILERIRNTPNKKLQESFY